MIGERKEGEPLMLVEGLASVHEEMSGCSEGGHLKQGLG